MTVFKGYLLIIRRNIGTILMYIGIFVVIALGIQQAYLNTGVSQGFSTMKLKVAVIDREGGALADLLRQVMEREQKLVEIPDDDQVIQEELYYSNVEYVMIIPEDAEEKLRAGEAAVQNISIPGAVAAYYVEAQVNNLLNQLQVWLSAGFSMEEACERTLALGETRVDVTLEDVNGNAGIRESYNYYFAYMPYAFLGAAIMTVGLVIMEFKKRGIRQRIQSSAVPFWKQNLSMAGAFLLIGGLIWGICMIFHVIIYRGGVFSSPNAGLYLMNSILCILAALSLGFLTGTVSNSPVALNGINNVVSLGLCFLGGIFVPLEMLGEGVQKVAHFLPTYWYSVINGMLGDYSILSEEMKSIIGKGFLIQLLFAAACFGITLMIRRKQLQEA